MGLCSLLSFNLFVRAEIKLGEIRCWEETGNERPSVGKECIGFCALFSSCQLFS